ncbi:hypothetical protein GF407_20380 [candidate division KSB1 bacterium]|nr:hypothetical protein [candidate division KSB1 bacterium]
MKKYFLITLFLFLMLSIAWHFAPESTQPESGTSQQVTGKTTTGNHMVVSIDPKTKRIKPDVPIPQELQQQIREMSRFSTKGLRIETLPNGLKRLDLQGRFQNYAVAVIDSSQTHVTCVTAEELEQRDEQEAQDE